MLTVNSTINLAGQAVPNIIPAVQGDTGRVIVFTLADFTIPAGSTATYYVQKPSGEAVYNSATIDSNKVTVELTAQSLAETGDNYGQVRILNGEDVVTSFDFILLVKPFRGIGAIESSTEMNIFDEAIQNAMEQFDSMLPDIIAPEFDSSTAYAAGDYVIYSGKLYQFTSAHAAGAWTGTDAEETTVSEKLGEGGSGDGLTEDIKQALLQIARKVAYIDDQGQDYYDDLYDALYAITAITLNTTSISLQTIGATYQLTATTVPEGGRVTWTSSNEAVATVSSTGLVTSVAYGSATITATAGSVSATCSVLVARATCTGITAAYTQSGTVYDSDALDSLKDDLVVTARWSDSTTTTLESTDYTLSGSLVVGISTITVSYGGQTDTFDVTVSQDTTHTEVLLATLVPGTDFTYDDLNLSASDGTTSESSSYKTSEFIAIPDGTTSFSFKFSKMDTNSKIGWYDSEHVYIGSGFGGGTYSGNQSYGNQYTDTNGDMWSAVPSNAKFVRICWRPSDNTFSYVKFKHNIKLDESITPVNGVVYYYTFSGSSTSANSDDYLPCAGMLYAHARSVYRRGYTLYDSDKIAVQTQAVANNIGNNVSIPSTATYIKFGNTTNKSTANNALPSRNGIGLIMFSNESLTSW